MGRNTGWVEDTGLLEDTVWVEDTGWVVFVVVSAG